MANIFHKLGVWLSINTAEYRDELNKAEISTKQFNRNIKQSFAEGAKATQELNSRIKETSLALLAFGVTVAEAFKYADEIQDTANAFDITVQSLLGLNKAMEIVGKSNEETTKMLSKMAVNAEEAKIGNDQLRDAFNKLHISGKEVENLAIDDLFGRIAEQLAKTESATTRNALAMQIFGKNAKAMNWNDVVEEYNKVGKASDELASAIDSASRAWKNLYQGAKTIVHELIILLKPLADLINGIAENLKDISKGKGAVIDWGLASGGESTGSEVVGGSPTKKGEIPSRIVKPESGGYTQGTPRESALASALANAKEQTKELIRQAELEIEKEKRITKYVTLSKNDLELQQEINRVTDITNKNIADTDKLLATERAKTDKTRSEALITELEKRKILLELEKDYEIKTITEIVRARQKEQENFMTGWNEAFTAFKQQADTYADVGRKSFQEVTTSMSTALENFVLNGKLSFADLIRSMIANLLKLQVQYASMQMFSAGASALASSSIGMAIGGYFKSTPSLSSVVNTTGGMADGGNPPVGMATLVGERGPELFIPNQSGTIIPNNQISNYMNKSGGITYNGPYIANLSAIDTQSATQFLANNKQAVWSANISAQRGLPNSR